MSAIEKLKAATSALAGIPVKIESEALGEVWVKPAISCAKANEIQNLKHEKGLVHGLALEVIYRAQDKDGKALFERTDLTTIMQEIDADILSGIYNDMKVAIYEGKSTAAMSSTSS